MERNMTLRYSANIQNIVDINESFCGARLRLCYVGHNRNGSSISKEVLTNAIPTAYNCPIVCNYDIESDTIGGHDVACVSDANGELKLVNLTDAVGVVPESAEYYWETIEENGEMREYLNIDVILWKRSSVFEKLYNDGFTSHSMEISVHKGRLEDGVLIIDEFTFLAFCLLGEDVEPCFESSELRLFDCARYKEQYTEMMKDLKEDFAKVLSYTKKDDIHTQYGTKGGKTQMELMNSLLQQHNLTAEQLNVNLDEVTYEELETIIQEFVASQSANPQPEPSLTAQQLLEEILSALRSVTSKDEWGTYSRYCYFDHDTEKCEVYCYDIDDEWKMYGFSYTLDGDSVTIDFESKKRKKIAIVDFIDGEEPNLLNYSTMANIISTYSNRQTAFNLSQLEDTHNAANEELKSLREFKEAKLKEERDNQVSEIFSRFKDLESVSEYTNLKENCEELSIAEIEEKCFAIRGRNPQLSFQHSAPSVRIPVDKTVSNSDELYGGFYTEFPPSK